MPHPRWSEAPARPLWINPGLQEYAWQPEKVNRNNQTRPTCEQHARRRALRGIAQTCFWTRAAAMESRVHEESQYWNSCCCFTSCSHLISECLIRWCIWRELIMVMSVNDFNYLLLTLHPAGSLPEDSCWRGPASSPQGLGSGSFASRRSSSGVTAYYIQVNAKC